MQADESCSDDPCSVDATCTDNINSFSCTCNGGFSGDGYNCQGKPLSYLHLSVDQIREFNYHGVGSRGNACRKMYENDHKCLGVKGFKAYTLTFMLHMY